MVPSSFFFMNKPLTLWAFAIREKKSTGQLQYEKKMYFCSLKNGGV